MNDTIISNLTVSEAFNLVEFCLHFFGAIVLSFLIKEHYKRYFPTLSRSQSMGNTLIATSITVFLVITVVKSSLALSLGLVGALSIVRFRTPIKEPFELAYLFLGIAVGLGFGAGQAIPTIIVVITLLLILFFLMKNVDKNDNNLHFVYVTLDGNVNPQDFEKMLLEANQQIEHNIVLRRLDYSKKNTMITMCVKLSGNDHLIKLTNQINNIFSPSDLSIVDGQKLMPF